MQRTQESDWEYMNVHFKNCDDGTCNQQLDKAVEKPEYKDGKRYQSVGIHYNGVGIIWKVSPEEMKEPFEEHIQKKQQEQQKRHSYLLHRFIQ